MTKTKANIIEIEYAQERRKAKRAELLKQEKMQKRRDKAKEKESRRKMSFGKMLAVFAVLVLAGVIFLFSGCRIYELNLDKGVYEKRLEEKEAEKSRLEKELSQIDDISYIGQQARDKFHMLREGEILYVFPEEESPEAQ